MKNQYDPRNDHKEFYGKNGFLVIWPLLSPSECKRIRSVYQPYADKDFAAIKNIDRQLTEIHALLKDPRIIQVIDNLQGCQVNALMTQYLYKEAGSKYAAQSWKPHQDNSYSEVKPYGAHLTINISLEDMDPENGGMYIYPGSHVEPILPFVPTPSFHEKDKSEDANPGNLVEIPEKYQRFNLIIPQGGMLVLHGHTIHGSYPNLSPTRSRPMYSATYCNPGAEYTIGKNAHRERINVH